MRTWSGKINSAVLAVICLLGPVLGQVHMLAVRHATCSEHGELIHVEDAGYAPRGDEIAASGSDSPTVESSRQDNAAPHEHDHCAATTNRRTAAPHVAAFEAQPVGTPATPLSLDASAPAGVRIAIFLLAPKNSPPA